MLQSRIALGNGGLPSAFPLPSVSTTLLTSAGAEVAAQPCSSRPSLENSLPAKELQQFKTSLFLRDISFGNSQGG